VDMSRRGSVKAWKCREGSIEALEYRGAENRGAEIRIETGKCQEAEVSRHGVVKTRGCQGVEVSRRERAGAWKCRGVEVLITAAPRR
jgi:hypothetical protein